MSFGTKDKESKKVHSSRYAAMYVPNTTGWDFFDAFVSSKPTVMALEANDLSLPGKKLDKYLKRTGKEFAMEFHTERSLYQPKIPPHIQRLIELQESDGKFYRLAAVIQCLTLPTELEFQRPYEPWEKATALAVAAFRQETTLFDSLYEYHDRAFEWIKMNTVLGEAREMYSFFCNPTVQAQFGLTGITSSSQHDHDYHNDNHDDDEDEDEDEVKDPFAKWSTSQVNTNDNVNPIPIPTISTDTGKNSLKLEDLNTQSLGTVQAGGAQQAAPIEQQQSSSFVLQDNSTIATNDLNFQQYLSSLIQLGNPNEDQIVLQKEIVAKLEVGEIIK